MSMNILLLMFKILALYGIPAALIDAIKILYTDTSATLLSPDGETEAFDLCVGIFARRHTCSVPLHHLSVLCT